MDLSRRRFLAHLGPWVALGGTGLLAACQTGQEGGATITVTAAPTQPATAKPGIAPVGSPAASPAASPVAAASPGAAAAPSPGVAAVPSPSPGVAAVASPSPRPAGLVAGKPQYQMDAMHTGRSPHMGPQRLALKRSLSLNDPSVRVTDTLVPSTDIQSSTVVGPEGTIYATTLGGALYALRDSQLTPDQLVLAWRFNPGMGAPFHATAAVSSDGATVYVPFTTGQAAAQQGALYAVRAPGTGIEGQLVWTAELGMGSVQNSPSIGPDGTLYIVNVPGVLSAIDPSNGRVRWTAQVGSSGQAQFGQTVKVAPAVAADGTVYVTAVTGSMYAVTPPSGSGTQGTVKWSFDFGQNLGSQPVPSTPVTGGGNRGQDGIGSGASPTISPDGTIYVGANNSNMYAIDPNGQRKWLFEAERELAGIWTAPALSQDASTIYFGANKGGIYALNTQNGQRRWQYQVYGSIYGSSALDASGTLYTGITAGQVVALNSANGELVSVYESGEAVWSAPSIRPDGTLVVVDRAARVLVLGNP